MKDFAAVQSSQSQSAAEPAYNGDGDRKIIDLATHPDPNVTPRQLADYWNKDIETIHRWIRKGALRAFKIGTGQPAHQNWLIKRDDAIEFEKWPE